MENVIKWALLGIFILYLVIGFFIGMIRGFKRMIMHIAFSLVAMIIALLFTKMITNAILGISIKIGGEKMTISSYILKIIEEKVDITKYKSMADFAISIPYAVASPVVFMVLQALVYFLLDIIYLIVAKVSFGKKKEEFKTKKPKRLLGALVGVVEGFVLMFLTFAPISSLTNTASALLYDDTSTSASVSSSAIGITDGDGRLQTISELAQDKVPEKAKTYLNIFNNSILSKVCSVGSLDDAMFDYMSTVRVEGQKVVFRKDVVNIAKAYNEFTVVYNSVVVDKDYTVETKKLRSSVEKVIDGGLFKAVVANTIRDVIINYEEIKTEFSISFPENLEVIEDIITNLHDTFSVAGFNAYKYLKHDIMAIIDSGSDILSQGLIDSYKNLPDKKVDTLIDFLDENKESLKIDLKNLLNLNLLDDNFSLITEKLEDYLKNHVQSDDPTQIQLNTSVSNRGLMIDDIFEAVSKVNNVNVSEIMNGEGTIIDRVKGLTDLDTKLTNIGEAIDAVRNLGILVIPAENEADPDTYVLDNILSGYGIDILGDTVHTSKTETIKLDTYTKFMNYIKTPVVLAQDMGALDMIDGGDFNDILNSLLEQLNSYTDTISKMVLPFHEITKQEIKTKVFDKMIEIMENTNILNFDAYEATDTYAAWKSAFDGLGETLKRLNTGSSEATGNKTYVKYLLDGGDVAALKMQDIGKVVDIVKDNAYNAGAALKGVLNDKFMEVVYIMTGDKIDSTKDYSAVTRLGYGDDNKYLDIKKFLDVANVNEYYTVNYEEKLTEIDQAINLANAMIDAVSGISIQSDPEGFINGIKNAINNAGNTEDETIQILNDLNNIASGNPARKVVDTSGLSESEKTTAINQINDNFSSGIATALKTLFDLSE